MRTWTTKRLLQVSSIAAMLGFAPVSFSSAEGLEENTACAQSGTCCAEAGSTCVIGSYVRDNAYFKSDGSCTEIK